MPAAHWLNHALDAGGQSRRRASASASSSASPRPSAFSVA
jgi:hypothetical protein